MPEPKSYVSVNDIHTQLFNLRMIRGVYCDGYFYHIDFSEHLCTSEHALTLFNHARDDFHEGIITSEEFEESNKIYTNILNKYILVDECGKICGHYFSNTRECTIFLKRIIINNTCCYYNVHNCVFNRLGTYLGYLTSDMQFVYEDSSSEDEQDIEYDESDYE